MDSLTERFFTYVKINTQSDETTGTHPSTPEQFVLLRLLRKELEALGAEDIVLSEHGVLQGVFPATPGCENAPALGLIAHVDTSDAASGRGVRPRIIRFDGNPVEIGNGKVLDEKLFPALKRFRNGELIVTDGSTLLGGDDKAGIAEILTAVEEFLRSGEAHGKLCLAFTPDEEIGEGTLFFDIASFGADYAFTVDGGNPCEVEFQNFNAACATVVFRGLSVHPGSAKDVMKNALKIAMEFDALLPRNEVPEHTCGLEGFYHLTDLSGSVSEARASYLLRDHDADSFALRHEAVEAAAAKLNETYGQGTVSVAIREQYRNMAEVLEHHSFLIDLAKKAIREAGLSPETPPIRGGTDGARLSFDGLPCPNLGMGDYNAHGECEFVSVAEMRIAVEVLKNIIRAFAAL